MTVIFWVLLRMDNTNYLLHGWRDALVLNHAVTEDHRQGFCPVL